MAAIKKQLVRMFLQNAGTVALVAKSTGKVYKHTPIYSHALTHIVYIVPAGSYVVKEHTHLRVGGSIAGNPKLRWAHLALDPGWADVSGDSTVLKARYVVDDVRKRLLGEK